MNLFSDARARLGRRAGCRQAVKLLPEQASRPRH